MDPTEILIVDDEPQVCDFLARSLTQRGFSCRIAGSGEQALEEVSQRKPTAVVTDLRMPGRDGRWLLGELKKHWQELPVIMLTGDGEAQTAVQCLKEGAEDYLLKPVNLEELFIAVRHAAEKVRLLHETREQRAHLQIAQSQSDRLREAFGVIETTYRETIGALLRAESPEPSGTTRPEGNGRSRAIEVRAPAPIDPESRSATETGKAIELSGLRVAGRLIGVGTPFVEVGIAIGNELVENDGLIGVRIWTHPEDGEHLTALVELGNGSESGRVQAERTFSSGEIGRVDSNAASSVTSPILVDGAPRAVLELVAPIQMAGSLVPSAERLSLVLAASLAREQDATARRRAVDELDLLYELASASRYSLDLEHVAEFLLASLDRIVDYDVASLLLVDEHPLLNIRTRFSADDRRPRPRCGNPPRPRPVRFKKNSVSAFEEKEQRYG